LSTVSTAVPATRTATSAVIAGAATKHDESQPLRAKIGTLPAPRPAAPPPKHRDSGPLSIPTPSLNFDGLGNLDSLILPDVNGDVGTDYYVQVVDLHYQIWDKTGQSIYGPAPLDEIWSGFGSPCEGNTAANPLLLYDTLADRWVLGQYTTSSPYGMCLAVSKSSDPFGTYRRYFFSLSTDVYYDSPRLGVWPDGYYIGANRIISDTLAGTSALVFERAPMLTGQTATYQEHQLPANLTLDSLLPADLDGTTAPATGAPAIFANLTNETLNLYHFQVNWTTPLSTTWTGPLTLDSDPYSLLCPNTRDCIAQPGTNVRLDSLSDRLFYRLAYRNFGSHDSLVLAHGVDAGIGQAGLRWYEVRSPAAITPTLYQQGTYAPDDGIERWAGSLAQDGEGNMALGFNVSDRETIFPGLRYAGRFAGEPLGELPQGETTLINGGGAQTDDRARWGNIASISIDPVDNCTFWFTGEYLPTTGPVTWQTRIGTFQFPFCGAGPQTPSPTPTATNTPTHTATRTPTPTITLTVTGTPPTATDTPTATDSPTPTATPCTLFTLTNGGFETGTLAGWTVVFTTPMPLVSDTNTHSGTYAVQLGQVTHASSAPNGDSAIAQQFTVPATGGTLSYWYWPHSLDSVANDWQDVTLYDSQNQPHVIMHVAEEDAVWKHITFDLDLYAGQQVRLQFLVHENGGLAETGMYVDDVQVIIFCPSPTPTVTGTPPTLTPTATWTAPPTITPTPCPLFSTSGAIATNDPAIPGARLIRNDPASSCAVPKSTPGTMGNGGYHYDAYTLTNPSATTQCVTVNLTSDSQCANTLFSAAYLSSFNPNNVQTNYLADIGNSPSQVGSYSFSVPASSTFVVIVQETTADVGCANYTVEVALSCAAIPSRTATPTPSPSTTPTVTATLTPLTCGQSAWNTLPPYPRPVAGAASVAFGARLYVFGGDSSTTRALTDANRYDPDTNRWTAIAPLPDGRAYASAVTDGTYIYILGGWDTNLLPSATLYRYDPGQDSYAALIDAPTSARNQAAVYQAGQIYRIGGCVDASCIPTANVDVYHVLSNTWSTTAPLPTDLTDLMAISLDGYVYAGGGSGIINPSSKTYRYSPSTESWDDTAISDLPAGRRNAASSTVNGRWLIAGGNDGSGPVTSTLGLDLAQNTWVSLAAAPQARAASSGGSFAGTFYMIGGLNSSSIPTTDGQQYREMAFQQVTSPNPGTVTNEFSAVAAAGATNVWAVGSTDPSGDTLIAHWDGSTWTQVASPSPGTSNYLYGVYAVSPTEAWAVGNADTNALILHWQGSSWTQVTSPQSGVLYAIHGSSASDIWAVGEYTPSLNPQALVLHWNGNAWSQISAPTLGNNSALYAVRALTANDVWAVGASWTGSNYSTVLLHWDGSSWSRVTSPIPGNVGTLHAVTALSASDVWAVGTTGDQTLTLHWNGQTWSQVSSPNPGSNGNVLYGVSGTRADDVWAVGEMDTASGPQTLVLHWDGGAWNGVSSPNPSSTVNALYGVTAISASDVWLVGYYAVTTATHTLVLHPCTSSQIASVTWTDLVGVTATGNTIQRTASGSGWDMGAISTLGIITGAGFVEVVADSTTGSKMFGLGIGNSNAQYEDINFALEMQNGGGVRIYENGTLQVDQPTSYVSGTVFRVAVEYDATMGHAVVRWYKNGVVIWTDFNPTLSYPVRLDTSINNQGAAIADAHIGGTALETEKDAAGQSASGRDTATERTLPQSITTTPPKAAAPLTALRTPTGPATPTACAVTFVDVPPGSTFYLYVRCLSCRGIVSGYPCGGPGEPCPGPYFRPASNVTRGQASKIISLAADFLEPVPSTQRSFEDVSPASTFWLYIERLASREVIVGYPCGGSGETCIGPANRPYFRPSNPVTRSQLSKIISNSASYTETPTSQSFQDVPSGSPFYLWIERIAAHGTINGYPCGGAGEPCVAPINRPYFRPTAPTTRSQVSKIAAITFFPNCDTPEPSPSPTDTPLATHTPAASPTPTGTPPPNPGCFSQTTSPNPGTITNVFNAVVAAGVSNIWAVGSTDPGDATLIAHWDGWAWIQVASPSPGQSNHLYGVYAVSPKEAWAVGNADTNALILHGQQGGSWTQVPNPAQGILHAIHGTSAADIWAVGESNVAPIAQALILHWNGSAWSQISVPSLGNKSSLYGVSALTANDVWAVGTASAGSNFTTVLLHWDGSAWSRVTSPTPGDVGVLHAITALSAGDVWAVGETANQTLVLHWDGLTWSQVNSPNPGSNGNVLYGVSAPRSADVWAVGEMDTPTGPQTLVLHWDGGAWNGVSSPNPSSTVNALYGVTAISASDVWLVGYYALNTATHTLILHSCPPARPFALSP
jgi:hypothetical protein